MTTTQNVVMANQLLSRRAKTGALLRYVWSTGETPCGMSEATRQVWEAMVFVGLVECSGGYRSNLSPAGKAVLELADQGEF